MADGGGKVGGRSFVCLRSVLFVCAVFSLFARVQCFVCLRVGAALFARSQLCALVIGQRTANDYVRPNTAGHDPR
jgi:hypothetical protein